MLNLKLLGMMNHLTSIHLGCCTFINLLLTLTFVVVETKDGTISVASAFAAHQEGNTKLVS